MTDDGYLSSNLELHMTSALLKRVLATAFLWVMG